MTHSYVGHDSFRCVTWLNHTCATKPVLAWIKDPHKKLPARSRRYCILIKTISRGKKTYRNVRVNLKICARSARSVLRVPKFCFSKKSCLEQSLRMCWIQSLRGENKKLFSQEEQGWDGGMGSLLKIEMTTWVLLFDARTSRWFYVLCKLCEYSHMNDTCVTQHICVVWHMCHLYVTSHTTHTTHIEGFPEGGKGKEKYSQLQMRWHRMLRWSLKLCQRTRILPMGITTSTVDNRVLIVNHMRILVRGTKLKVFKNNLKICATLSAIGCLLITCRGEGKGGEGGGQGRSWRFWWWRKG